MINYIEDGHYYLKDNLTVVPSVSELVRFACNENYGDIPQEVLIKAGKFGTDIHEAIENYLKNGEDTIFFDDKHLNSFNEFKRLKDEHIGKDNSYEQLLNYNERYAGRYDLISDGVLIDYKTNYRFDDKLKKHLEWQMGYYKLALESKGIVIKNCYCLYLPKDKKGKWVEIEPTKEILLLENLKEYEKQINESERNLKGNETESLG